MLIFFSTVTPQAKGDPHGQKIKLLCWQKFDVPDLMRGDAPVSTNGNVDLRRQLDLLARYIRDCDSIAQAKMVRAECIEIGKSRLAKEDTTVRIRAADIRIRAERWAGHSLSSRKLRGGRRRGSRLKELGVSQNESTRWQLLASIEKRVFEEYLSTALENGNTPSASELLRIARGSKSTSQLKFESLKDLPAGDPMKELCFHLHMLDKVITPIFYDNAAVLRPVERDYIQRTLDAMQEIVDRLTCEDLSIGGAEAEDAIRQTQLRDREKLR